MSSIAKFSRGWTFCWWSDPDGSSGTNVPPGTFPIDGGMDIRALDPERCAVAWKNEGGGECWMELFYQDGQLRRSDFLLHLAGTELYCQTAQIQEVISDNGTTRILVAFLNLQVDGQTGNAGTFVAQAPPDPKPPGGDGGS